MSTMRNVSNPGCGDPVRASPTQRRGGLFRAFVDFFDDPILLCDSGGHRPHHCDGDDRLPASRWAPFRAAAPMGAGA